MKYALGNRPNTAREVHYEAMADAKRLEKAIIMQNAIFALVDRECPCCNKLLELPSLEDIQNWLEENEGQ